MNGGIGVSIGSQMTQEEIEAYAVRMLAVLNVRMGDSAKVTESVENQNAALSLAQMRTSIVCQVINACGRPIAKAEQEQMAIMTENLKRQGNQRQAPAPVWMRDGAFGGSNGEES